MAIQTSALMEFCLNTNSQPGGGFENDIVFVHGLCGDARRTWTSNTSDNPDNLPWPQLFLPADLEWTPSRILTFSYDARIWDPAEPVSQAKILDNALRLRQSLAIARASCRERPLIFVAHSLGGLIVKQMLLLTETKIYMEIASSTRGVIFFGTPHRGSDDAVRGAVAVTVLNVLGRRPNKQLVQQLQPTNDTIQYLEQEFPMWAQNHHIEISCFYEQKHMSGVRLLPREAVVTKRSATIDGFTALPLDSDHIAMVKFATREGDYQSFLFELRKSLSIKPAAVNRVIRQDNARAMKALLKSGFDINNTTIDSGIGPAACVAAMNGKVGVFKVLMADGNVQIDQPDNDWQQTPLFRAAKSARGNGGHLEIMRLLLDSETSRVDVDSRDIHGQTPLISAVRNGCMDAVHLLLDHGASWETAGGGGNAYYWAEVRRLDAFRSGNVALAGQYQAVMRRLEDVAFGSSPYGQTDPERLEGLQMELLAIQSG